MFVSWNVFNEDYFWRFDGLNMFIQIKYVIIVKA